MGNFLTILNTNPRQPPQKYTLLKISLSKLREYHGSFKSICDTFAIDPQDFENIFGNNEHFNALQHFQLWDTDKNQLIDALELFAGLIIFSNDNFNEKVRFLFDIFDFNELNSLSIIDLEFMLISCCNATFKIYQMESDINEENISEFLHSDFKEDQRINISQMITWCAKKQEIQDYCELIKIKAPQSLKKQEIREQQTLKPTNDVKPLTEIITSKKYQQKLDWLSALSKKLKFLNQQNMSSANKDIMIKPKWVYGFRSQGVKKPLAYLRSGKTDKILYFTANIVVIFYPQLNQQDHYLEHDREVISLGIGYSTGLVASGELGEQAAIHIWDSNNMQNIGIIKGIHKQGVSYISFFKNDQFIATCGMRENTPILIYNVKDLSLVLSTFVQGNALSLLTIRNYIGDFSEQQNGKNLQDNNQEISVYNYNLNNKIDIDQNIIYENYQNSFVVLTPTQIILFLYMNNQFHQNVINIAEHSNEEENNNQNQEITLNGEITCAQIIRINTENPYLKAYTDDNYGSVQVILGTDKGYLYYFDWPYYEDKKEFQYQQHYQTAIVNIETYKYGVIVSSAASTIHLWDFNFSHNIKNIDLTNFQFKLFNYDIIDVLVVGQQLMVSTTNGDIIEIDMNQKQEWTQNKFIQKLNATRVNYITKFQGDLQAMCLMERQENDDKILFVAGSSTIIYGFSVQTHEIVDVWTIGGDQPITCMDCVNFEDGGTIFVIGCAGTPSKLIMRIDWEEQPRTLEIAQTVHDVRFSSDTYYLIAACGDGCIYLYMHNQNHYFNVLPKKIQFDNEIPISIDFVDDNKSFLVGTSVRNQYKIELPDLKNKIILQENEKINCTVWKLRYPLHTKNFSQTMLPIIIGGDIKVFLAAGESGYLYFWRDHEQLESNCGGFLKGHASQISRILMAQSQNQFFTVGKNDNTVIEWSVDFINEFNDFSKPFPTNQHLMINQQQIDKQIQIKDEVLVRELAYSFQGKNDFICDSFKDQFVLFRGTNQKTLNQHLYDLLSQDYVQEESNLLKKRPPPLSIELDFIFGFASFDKRQTLQYVHIHQEERKASQKLGKRRKKEESRQQYKMDLVKKLSKHKYLLEYQKRKVNTCLQNSSQSKNNNTLQYEQYHENCHRNFVYFVSRIVIVYNPLTNKQKFYQGHQNKITAIAIHPLKFYVASGEASSKPSIHVWNVVNCEPYKILPTFHKNGIIHLTFSQDSKLILSAGMDISFSIQITNWQTEEIVAFRNSGLCHIFDLKFNPFNSYEFVTCGTQNITIWNLDGRNLLRKYYINITEESFHNQSTCITCIQFISFRYNGGVESDIICGNNMGDISLVTNGKYIVAKQRAHAKMINCLKVSEAFKDKVIIITAGEDECIKFWDTKFNQINQIQISQMKNSQNNVNFFQHYQELKTKSNQKNCSAQSIDVYICIPDKKPDETKDIDHKKKKRHLEYLQNKTWSKILIGTRNGDIIEATFSLDISKFDYNKQQLQQQQNTNQKPALKQNSVYSNDNSSDSSDEEDIIQYIETELYGQQSKGFGFNYSLFLRSHSSQIFKEQNFSKKVYFSLHPYHPILVTVGEDQNMCVWDITSNKLLSIEYLSKTPSAIKFSPEGDLLVIGLTSGDLVIYDSKIKKSLHGKAGDKYDLPQFSKSLIQWIKVKDRTETAILNIEFSQKGELLAVSYDNVRQQKELEGKYEKEGSYITIYSNRASHKSNKPRGQEKLLYAQYIDIRCPSTYESYKTENNAYGCAAYFMTFSQEQEKEYLLIYYQLIDNYLVRVNHDSQGTYLIWDLTNNNAVKQWDSIKNIQWRCFNFPNSINSQYQQYSNLIISENSDQQQIQIPQNQAPPFQSVMLDLRTWENNKYQFLVTGSIKGDLHFVKNTCLSGDKDFVTENIPKEKMFLAKSYAAHVSFVNQIEAVPTIQNCLFTSGIADECVFKWKFVQEEQLWDLDFLEYKLDQPDVFSELVKKDKFINLYSEVLPLRRQASDAKLNVDNTRQSPVELKLKNIIGRNAYTKLNNLFYDFDENIVYISGCNLVIINPRSQDNNYYDNDDYYDEDNQLNQQVIKLDQSESSCDSDISCISLSEDKKFLVAGTIQMNGKILIWDICSRTCIRTFILKNVPIILLIKFAFDNRHLCCVGLTSDYTMKVFLIDSHIPAVLGCANFPYSLPFKIKDIQFFPDSIYKFVTCGVQHMTIWSLNGGQLSYQSLEIENPKDIEEQKKVNQQEFDKQQDDQNLYDEKDDENRENDEEEEISKENLRVIFLCLAFVYDIIITGGEDGYLYIWEDKVIKQKHLTQKKIIIMALSSLKDTNLFVSGSMNGVINLWSIQKGEYYYVLERVFQHNISREESIESIKYPQNIIQSLCIGSKYILVGTKSGDIYEILRPQDKDEMKMITNKQQNQTTNNNQQNQQQQDQNSDVLKLRISCNDDDIPQSLAFSSDSTLLYTITSRGLFSVWNISYLERRYVKNFSTITHSLIVCKHSDKIIIAFDNEIQVLNKEELEDSDNLSFVLGHKIQLDSSISDMKMSHKENLLAVALNPSKDQQAKIEIYDANRDDGNFKILCQVGNLPTSIEYIDFTQDNYYLIYKDNFEEVSIIDLKNLKKINTLFVEHDAKWCSDGIKVSEKTKGVFSYYNDENRINQIVPIGEQAIAVTDEMGTIRIFEYPCESAVGHGYLKCYTDHLNYINQCILSPDQQYLVTSSQNDRCIIIWNVIQNQVQMERDSDMDDDEIEGDNKDADFSQIQQQQ